MVIPRNTLDVRAPQEAVRKLREAETAYRCDYGMCNVRLCWHHNAPCRERCYKHTGAAITFADTHMRDRLVSEAVKKGLLWVIRTLRDEFGICRNFNCYYLAAQGKYRCLTHIEKSNAANQRRRGGSVR